VWLRRSLPSVGQPVAAHRHGQAPGRVHAGTFTRLGWRATIHAADMPDKPIIRERIDRILARYGITPAMVREHITTHYGWFREFSPASGTNFRASEVAAILELLEASRQHPAPPPAFPSDFLTAYEVAWLVFRGPRQISWITQRLPAGFPPRDPMNGCWKRAAVEAWLSENLAARRKAPGKTTRKE
jgi:hypothetical protein